MRSITGAVNKQSLHLMVFATLRAVVYLAEDNSENGSILSNKTIIVSIEFG